MLLPARTEAAAVAPSDRATRPLGLEAETWLLVGITVLAAAVRFANITSQSFWLDESQAVHEVHLSFGSMLHAWSSFEWNGPLYLLIAWPWAKLFGAGELGLRSLSAVLGVVSGPAHLPVRARARLAASGAGGGRVHGRQPVHDLVLAGGARVHAADGAVRRVAAVLRPRVEARPAPRTCSGGPCSRRSRC